MENNNNRQDPKKSQNRKSIIICLVAALGMFLIFSFMNSQVEKASNKEITYDQFIKMLEDGQVKEVILSSDNKSLQRNRTPRSGLKNPSRSEAEGYPAGSSDASPDLLLPVP